MLCYVWSINIRKPRRNVDPKVSDDVLKCLLLTRTHKIFSLLPERRKRNHFLWYLNKCLCRAKRTSKWDRGRISIEGESFTQSWVKFGSAFLLFGNRFICFQWQAEQSEGRNRTRASGRVVGSARYRDTQETETFHLNRCKIRRPQETFGGKVGERIEFYEHVWFLPHINS